VPTPTITITTSGDHDPDQQRAASLATELGYRVASPGDRSAEPAGFLLVFGDRGLELRSSDAVEGSSIRVDFVRGATAYRRESARQRHQLLARAVGLRGDAMPVFDATAGLGRDAFLLACLGCKVTAVERSPVLFALLRDAIERARDSGLPDLATIIARITLLSGDARGMLSDLAQDKRPEVVYIDPMYPESRKSALAKKEMRICRRLVGDDEDAAGLLAVARSVGRRRVVIKRHRHAPPLAADPSVTYRGRTVRYDAYDRVTGPS
jgi:16S rRNA (guanine1516-N2)-methyltransferase